MMSNQRKKIIKIFKNLLVILSIFAIQSQAVLAVGVFLINNEQLEENANIVVFDYDDTGGDITLQFGQTLNKQLKWDDTNSYFSFNDDINLEGNEIKNFRVDNLASVPVCDGTGNGRVYYNTVDIHTYVCNGTSWVQIDGGSGAGGTLAAVQARNSAGFTLTNQSQWYDITMGNTDVESDAAVIEHDNINTERINIKSDGTYLVTYTIDAVDNSGDHGLQVRVYINGTTVLNGSYQEGTNYMSEHAPTTGSFLADLTTNDYITLQAQRLSANTIVGEPTLTVTKLDGVLGDPGPQGLPGSVGLGTNENTFTLDLDDTGGSVDLIFGTTVAQYLRHDGSGFIFSDDLQITGALTGATIDGDDNTIQDIDFGSLKTRTKKLAIGFDNLSIIEDGSNNLVNVYIDSEGGVNPHEYYLLKTTQTGLQDVDLRIKVKLPEDFVDFSGTGDLNFSYKNSGVNNTDSKVDILVEDNDGDDAYSAASGQGLFSAAWAVYADEFDGAGFDPAAGEYLYITLKGFASYSGGYQSSYLGEIVLTYIGR